MTTQTIITEGTLIYCIQVGHSQDKHPARTDCLTSDDRGRSCAIVPAEPTKTPESFQLHRPLLFPDGSPRTPESKA
jgi:hypothetical protein